VVVAVIVLQFAVPLVAFVGGPLPTRFGFQMYSGLGGTSVEVLDSDGRALPADWHDYVASLPRPDLDWSTRLPAHLCAQLPDAASVVLRRSGRESVVACN
jgi:hypothetical protein